MTKLRWWVAAAPVCAWALGCSDTAEPQDPRGPVVVDTAGTRAVDPSGNGARAQRGSVTLLGANAQIAVGSWPFSGPPSNPAPGEDTVSCQLGTRGSKSVFSVAASKSQGSAPAANFTLEVDALAAFEKELSYSGFGAEPLDVSVSFESLGSSYFYAYDVDSISTPAVNSRCTASVSKLTEQWATGQLVCRSLIASTFSADAPADGEAPPSASATIAFDCPIALKSAPEPGGGGRNSGGSASGGTFSTSGSGGVAGSGGGGGSSAGSDPGGGTGGTISIPKSCRGVAASCSSRTSGTCASVRGCSTEGECDGLSSSCYSQYSSYSCTSQQGCYWSSLNKSCSGSARSCRLFSGSSSCVSQNGCSWRYTCEGVSTACVLLGEFDCEQQPGCTWN